jgi:hypothetical protein
MRVAGRRTAAVVIASTILVCVVAIAGGERASPPPPPSATQPPPPSDAPAPDQEEVPAPEPAPQPLPTPEPEDEPASFDWLKWLGIALLLAAALLLARELRARRLARPRRLRVAREPDAEPDAEELRTEAAREAVDAALTPLRDPTDPRSAVIEAYVRMQHVLADRGLGRRPPETPREHLGRVLAAPEMPERSLTTLTTLFEEARFSVHPVPDSAPDRATAELEHARAALGDPP